MYGVYEVRYMNGKCWYAAKQLFNTFDEAWIKCVKLNRVSEECWYEVKEV